MTKAKLAEQIKHIGTLNKRQLIAYSEKIYISQPNIAPKAFTFLKRAMDIQMMNLKDETDLSPMAVLSDLRMGEV